MIRVMNRIIGITALVLTVGALVFAGVFTIPRLFGVEPYIVESGSMAPLIPTGAAAFIDTRVSPKGIGDVIAYRTIGLRDEEPVVVTHRIVGRSDEGWITRGDANDMTDSRPVVPEAVVGIYLFSIPRAGFILAGMTREKIIAAVILLGSLNALSMALQEIVLTRERKRRRSRRHWNYQSIDHE